MKLPPIAYSDDMTLLDMIMTEYRRAEMLALRQVLREAGYDPDEDDSGELTLRKRPVLPYLKIACPVAVVVPAPVFGIAGRNVRSE